MNKTHGMHGTPVYRTWESMIHRCTNPNNRCFKYYGGRGIQVCERWRKFMDFYADMGNRPEGLTIDRVNNNGNYEKSNCKWATRLEQADNRRIQKITMSNKTGVTGVSWSKRDRKYCAHIQLKGKTYHLGSFDTVLEAAEARKQGELKYWGLR